MNKYEVEMEWWEDRIVRCSNKFIVIAKDVAQACKIAQSIREQTQLDEEDRCFEENTRGVPNQPREWTDEEYANLVETITEVCDSEVIVTSAKELENETN